MLWGQAVFMAAAGWASGEQANARRYAETMSGRIAVLPTSCRGNREPDLSDGRVITLGNRRKGHHGQGRIFAAHGS